MWVAIYAYHMGKLTLFDVGIWHRAEIYKKPKTVYFTAAGIAC